MKEQIRSRLGLGCVPLLGTSSAQAREKALLLRSSGTQRALVALATATLSMLLPLASAVAAEDKPGKPEVAKGPPLDVVEMTLYPAVPPRPAMKYRLMPRFLEQTPGNAAPLYLKACLLCAQQGIPGVTPRQARADTWDKIAKWQETPLDKLPLEEVRQTVGQFDTALHEVRLASRRTRCDWDSPIREEGEHVFEILLPEMQAMRDLGRVLALKVRLEMAEGRYAEAFDTLQTGFAMSRHCAEQGFLVSGLVGRSVAGIFERQLETMIQLPDVPNLYWTVTVLPRPLIDLDKGLEAEEAAVYLMFPEFRQAQQFEATPEQWQAVLDRGVAKFKAMVEPIATDAYKATVKDLTSEEVIKRVYPAARAMLVASGRSEQQVDAMPEAEVVLMGILDRYDDLRDDMFKWFHVPYWEAREGIAAVEKRLSEAAQRQPDISAVGCLLLPTVGGARFVVAKTERDVDALRCIEAIRFYAVTHDGMLPGRLEDITEVPIPTNPVTGKPFGYHLEGDTAVLDADGPADKYQRQYRMKIGARGER